ncbi:MAG TPA: tetratricopeptide repeat protein [Geobacterales bacterium]|nr:tetratricopeptide repeat protein [Geobacterales bacterium]
MSDLDVDHLFQKGMEALAAHQTLAALTWFERAAAVGDSPSVRSCLAYLLARERGQLRKALLLCQGAITQEPHNYLHHLNLGRILLLAGDKSKALVTLRHSMELSPQPDVIAELQRLGVRKPPPFPSLPRNNPLNKFFGLILSRLRLR